MAEITLEKQIKDLITKDTWFKENYPKLIPVLGLYSPVGNTYPSIAYSISFGESEPIIPAVRKKIVFVVYVEDNNNAYGIIKTIVEQLERLLNRKSINLCSGALRVVGCHKTGGDMFFNSEIRKRGADLMFDIVMSEDEEIEDSNSESSSESESSSSIENSSSSSEGNNEESSS
jgi:hypothetical protein